jgi:hypothetical protein
MREFIKFWCHMSVWVGIGTLLAVGLVSMLSVLAHGQSQHVLEAMMHAQAAVAQGKQGYPDALVTQAQAALEYAGMAKNETSSPHLEEGIRMLREAIDQGKQGHGEAATEAAESALAHLAEDSKSTARSAQEESGY